mmetsp:Transcript_9827/g.18459  ORF Transcript_9827/g.18459 Transcript_9827/m.18459 type:complete len:89 (-) Transcript_9827:3939-4205(-)
MHHTELICAEKLPTHSDIYRFAYVFVDVSRKIGFVVSLTRALHPPCSPMKIPIFTRRSSEIFDANCETEDCLAFSRFLFVLVYLHDVL